MSTFQINTNDVIHEEKVKNADDEVSNKNIQKKASKRIYKCEDCGFMTKKVRQMQVHLHVHEPEKPFQCDICMKSYSKLSVMKRHRMSHSTQKNYLCDLCGKSYNQIMSFKYHKLSHMKFLEDSSKADKLFQNLGVDSIRNEKAERRFLCDLCGKFFKQSITLKVHKKWHEKNKDWLGRIKGVRNAKNPAKIRLLKRNHSESSISEKRKPFKCSECPFMASHARDVLSHMYVHTGKKPFHCHICKRWFSKPNTLKRHVLSHDSKKSMGNGKKPFDNNSGISGYDQLPQIVTVNASTLDCDKPPQGSFASATPVILKIENPKNDKMTNKANNTDANTIAEKHFKQPGKKRYCCDECPYSSQSSRDLKVHKRRHTGEKPYACTVCNKAFANRSVMKRHISTVHSEQRAHICSICGKGYTQSSNLKMHKLTHYNITTGELISQAPVKEDNCHVPANTTSNSFGIVDSGQIISSTSRKISEKCAEINESVSNTTLFFEKISDYQNTEVYKSPIKEIANVEDYDDSITDNDFTDDATIRSLCDNLKNVSNNEEEKCNIEKNTEQWVITENKEEFDIKCTNIKDETKDFDETDDIPLIFQMKSLDSSSHNKGGKFEMKLLKKQSKTIQKRREIFQGSDRMTDIKPKVEISKEILLKCSQCHYTVTKKRDLERHLRSHSKEKPYQCDICKRHFSDKSVVKRHKLIHFGIKKFTCHFCGKKFSQSTGLKAHMVSHTGSPPVLPHTCDLCGNTFSQLKSLKAHRHVHFRGNYSTQYTCTDCGKCFSFECRLKEHQLTHSGERNIACDLCDKKFLRVKDMRSHRLLHTREQKSICDKCGKFFATPKTLRLHTQCHSEEKPFVCHVCGATFYRQSHLTRHTALHIGTKSFGCTLCSKRFTQRSALNRHTFLHSNTTPYSCNVCSKQFKMLDNFKKHIKRTKHLEGNDSANAQNILKLSTLNNTPHIANQLPNG